MPTHSHSPRQLKRARRPLTGVVCRLWLLHALILLALDTAAAPATAGPAVSTDSTMEASVITCWPGTEVYELYGHTALRIRGADFDSVWNYGVFDYSEPNFIGRFVHGDLNYQVAGYPFAWFMPSYEAQNRRVEEQVLRLTPAQVALLRRNLQINALPQNRVYLYDYVKDNCSTRVWAQVDSAAGGIAIPAGQLYPTYREAMRAHHSHYPWYALGIDVALGTPIDTLITNSDQLFLPLVLHDKLAGALLPSGLPAVRDTRVLSHGVTDATLPPTPWWLSPLTWGWVLLGSSTLYCAISYRRRRSMRWLEAVVFSLFGLAGCVVVFLTFFSIHRAASPNLLLLWLNPLALVVPLCIWSRRTRPLVVAYMVANFTVVALAAIVWPFQTQSGNPAFLPLVLTDLMLSACYTGIYIRNRR